MHPSKRRRGFILSSHSWQRLQAAESLSSIHHNQAQPYTLEQLNQITGLSCNTLTKLRRRQIPVDWNTLKAYFASFGLTLHADDVLSRYETNVGDTLTALQEIPFTGPLPLNSPFYIYRGSERGCTEEIFKPGALLRIEAPHKFGKTSLMAYPLSIARDRNFRISAIDLKCCERTILQDLDRFLQWFCAVTAKNLGMPNEFAQGWDRLLGSSYSCSKYFQTYLLPAADAPLLLVIDGIEELFDHPQLATDFLRMLGSWHERASYGLEESSIWQQLRLVLIQSTEEFGWSDVNQSSLNVGWVLRLPAFTWQQVEELAYRYRLEQADECARSVFTLVGGHPYLDQLALFHLSQKAFDLEEFFQKAVSHESIFKTHLQQKANQLQQKPTLLKMMRSITQNPEGMEVSYQNAFQLQGMGLIGFRNQLVIPSCELYRRYFRTKGFS